jgi:aspartate kinase
VEGNQELVRLISELETLGEVDFQPEMAIICLVGEDIRGRIGIASDVFGVLAASGINIRMIAQGSSEISVSFVVEEKDAVRSVQQLHRHLFEQPSASPSHSSAAPCETAQA